MNHPVLSQRNLNIPSNPEEKQESSHGFSNLGLTIVHLNKTGHVQNDTQENVTIKDTEEIPDLTTTKSDITEIPTNSSESNLDNLEIENGNYAYDYDTTSSPDGGLVSNYELEATTSQVPGDTTTQETVNSFKFRQHKKKSNKTKEKQGLTTVLPVELEIATTEAKPELTEPNLDLNEPKSTEITSDSKISELEPNELDLEPTESIIEPSESIIEPTELNLEPKEPNLEPREPDLEPTEPNLEPIQPNLEPTEPNVELTLPPEAEVKSEQAGEITESFNFTENLDITTLPSGNDSLTESVTIQPTVSFSEESQEVSIQIQGLKR